LRVEYTATMASKQTMLEKMKVLGEMLVKDKATPAQCLALARDAAKLSGYTLPQVKSVLNSTLLMHGMPLI
jgi:hypothetical protein